VFPGLAVARELLRRGHAVKLWLAGTAPEAESLAGWEGPVQRVRASGFEGLASFGSLLSAYRLAGATVDSLMRMRRDPPAVLLAMGSYASVGPALAARALGIPFVIHEANAIPGRAVALLARCAWAVALTFESAARYLPKVPAVVTGLPVRSDLQGQFAESLLEPNIFTVLVMGGSQGAHRINEVAVAAFLELRNTGERFQVIHLAGRADADWVETAYRKAGVKALVFSFLREIGKAYCAANMAISRAGASSCMELALYRVPCLLIPFPTARRDHQTANAREMCQSGGADMIQQKDLTPGWLRDYLRVAMHSPEKLTAMRASLAKVAIPDAVQRLADLVETAVKTL